MKINLGCGHKHLKGFINVDANPLTSPDVVLNIGRDPWPWEDSSVEHAALSHILEHLDTDEFFHCMKELYRVMKPGCPVNIAVPHPRHDVFLNDPTHKKPITLTTLSLFDVAFLREHNWAHTPFARYFEIDFRLLEVKCVMDPRVTHLSDEEIADLERRENNVIIEYHVLLSTQKPYSEDGE